MRMPTPPVILVVHRHPFARLALSFELEEHGFQVFEARDRATALAALSDDVHALVVEHSPLHVDGLELLEEIEALRPDLRAVVLVASPSEAVQRRAEAAGVVALLPKPVEPAQVALAVERAVGTRGAPRSRSDRPGATRLAAAGRSETRLSRAKAG